MNIIDVIDNIGDVAEIIERTKSVLSEAQRYFEAPITPGTSEAICLIDSATHINNLLGTVSEGLYNVSPELDKAVKDLNVCKRVMLEPTPTDLTIFIEEAGRAIEKANSLLSEYLLELKNKDDEFDVTNGFLLLKGGVYACFDLVYGCFRRYEGILNKRNATD